MILPRQRCLDNRSRNIRQCASNVLVDIRNTSVIFRGSINKVFQVGVGVEDHKKYSRKIAGIARSPRYNQDMTKHVLERRQRGCR